MSYRYLLTRTFGDDKNPAVFCMLNPSTADERVDDPTIRRCKGFARAWGHDSLVVVNAYGLRATKPHDLFLHHDPIGPDNDKALKMVAHLYRHVVVAWGGNLPRPREDAVVKILQSAGATLWSIGQNRDGSPRHPLYVPGTAYRELWGR